MSRTLNERLFEIKKAGETFEWNGRTYEPYMGGTYHARTEMRWDPELKRDVPIDIVVRLGPAPCWDSVLRAKE